MSKRYKYKTHFYFLHFSFPGSLSWAWINTDRPTADHYESEQSFYWLPILSDLGCYMWRLSFSKLNESVRLLRRLE